MRRPRRLETTCASRGSGVRRGWLADGAGEQATTKTIEAAQYRDRGLMLKRQIKAAQRLHQPQLRQDVAGASSFVTQTQSKRYVLSEQADQLFRE